MINGTEAGTVAPFESAGELHEVNECLLEALDNQLGSKPSTATEVAALLRLEPQIREFVERGAATGACIEEITERTACQTLVDYWASNLARAGADIGRARLAQFDSKQLPELPNELCPYMGLETFREANRSVFFGRDEAIEKVLAHLRAASLVVVSGASGSGKSSLVLGGVLPRLKDQHGTPGLHIVSSFVPGTDVLAHLATSVRRDPGAGSDAVAADVKALRSNPHYLGLMIGAVDAQPTLIIIDQFEEVFTLCEEVDRKALVANLAQFLEGQRLHRLILTVREEFESRMKEQVLPSFQCKRAWYAVPEMDYEGLRAAIMKPAEAVNLHFKPEVVDHLVRRVIHQPGALPLLQFTLRALWDVRDHNRITQEVYAKIGGDPLVVLANSAKAFLDDHKDPETLDEIKRVLLELVRVDERLEAYRQPVAKSWLLATGKANTKDVLKLLETSDFVRITPDLDGKDAVVEVKHESLVRNWPGLVTWIGEKRDRYRQRLGLTEAAANWARNGKPEDDGLLTGSLLAEAAKQPDLSELEQEYVRASDNAADKVRRELERTNEMLASRYKVAKYSVIVGVVLFLCMCLAGVYVILQQLRLREAALTMRNLQAGILSDVQVDLLNGAEAARRGEIGEQTFRSLIGPLARNLEVVRVFSGHTGEVRAVKFSPDGRVLASASTDGTITLRDMGTYRLLHAPWRAHGGAIYSLAFDSDGKKLASAGDTTVKLWDVASGEEDHPFSHDSEVYAVAIDPRGGNLMAVACKDGTVVIWDLARRTKAALLVHNGQAKDGRERRVNSVAYSSDGKFLASGGDDGRIVLWDLGTRTRKAAPMEAYDPVFSLAISHDGKMIASGHQHGEVYLWDIKTAKWTATLTSHERAVFGISFSPNDALLATTSADHRVQLHTLSGQEEPTATDRIRPIFSSARQLSGVGRRFYGVDFRKDGKLATGTDNGSVALWNLRRPARFGEYMSIGAERTQAAFTGDGKTLILYSQDSLRFRPVQAPIADPGRPETQRIVNAGQKGVKFVFAFADGKDLLTIGQDNSIKRWEWDATKQQYETRTLAPPMGDMITAAAYAAERQSLVFATYTAAQHEARIWRADLPAGNPTLISGTLPDVNVFSLAVTRKADLLAISFTHALIDGTSLWSLDPVHEVRTLPDVEFSLAFSPDGRRLASADRDGRVSLWDTDTEALPQEPVSLDAHTNTVMSLTFSPDGSKLATGSVDKTAILWDVATGQPLSAPLDIYFGDNVDDVQVLFSPDGRFLSASAFRGGTKEQEADGGVMLWQMSLPTLLYDACETAGRNMTAAEWKSYFGEEPYRITCPGSTAADAEALALAGDKKGAEAQFAAAWKDVLAMGDLGRQPDLANDMCWRGSTSGLAATVKAACDKAVEWADSAVGDLYRDSRGLARALTGDKQGAIADFESVVAYLNNEPGRGGYSESFIRRRGEWIVALRKGDYPFSAKLLDALRTEDGSKEEPGDADKEPK